MPTFYAEGEPLAGFAAKLLKGAGWKRVHSFPADLVIVYGPLSYGANMRNTRGSRVLNLLEGPSVDQLTDKLQLAQLFGRRSWIPKTHVLDLQAGPEMAIPKTFRGPMILKPLGGYQGSGITVSNERADLVQWLQQHAGNAKFKRWVLQEYIQQPALKDGFKFHIRVLLVIVARGHQTPTEVYMVLKNRMVLAAAPYRNGSWVDEAIHDTHFRHNARAPFFPGDQPDGWTREECLAAQKRMVAMFKAVFQDHRDFRAAWGSKSGFEMLGGDVILDNKSKKPMLLEINKKMAFHPTQEPFLGPILGAVLNADGDLHPSLLQIL